MHTIVNLARLAAPVAAVVLLAGCADGDDDELTSTSPAEDSAAEDSDAGTQDTDVGTEDDDGVEADGGDDAGASNGEQIADTDAADQDGDATTSESGTSPADELVDLTEAIPGTWPVGEAGTVTFSLVDAALVLDDVSASDGWSFEIDEQDADEIEVDFARGNVGWEIEIELEDDGRILDIEIDQSIEPADTGSYDLGDAGTFAFSVVDGRLVLDDLSVSDGWTLVELDEEADEIEFELVNGPRSFDVEVELDDEGTIELDIGYEVTGPVTG